MPGLDAGAAVVDADLARSLLEQQARTRSAPQRIGPSTRGFGIDWLRRVRRLTWQSLAPEARSWRQRHRA